MARSDHVSAAQLQRRKERIARRELRDRIWNIVLLVIAAIIMLTIIAIQLSHHI